MCRNQRKTMHFKIVLMQSIAFAEYVLGPLNITLYIIIFFIQKLSQVRLPYTLIHICACFHHTRAPSSTLR